MTGPVLRTSRHKHWKGNYNNWENTENLFYQAKINIFFGKIIKEKSQTRLSQFVHAEVTVSILVAGITQLEIWTECGLCLTLSFARYRARATLFFSPFFFREKEHERARCPSSPQFFFFSHGLPQTDHLLTGCIFQYVRFKKYAAHCPRPKKWNHLPDAEAWRSQTVRQPFISTGGSGPCRFD